MPAALKTESVVLPRRSTRGQTTKPRRLTVVPVPQAAASPVALPLPSQRERPLWLKLLIAGQRLSLVVAGVAVTGALSAYALTVDNNRRLTAATATLGRLQDHQQQLITANAVFKNHLAQTAIAALNAGMLHPSDVIFLEAEPLPTSVMDDAAAPQEVTSPPERRFFPKGY
ncbi:MAG: hypothetical protein ACFBSG_13070 [Leptolyngbyaceae cyanobacterium]